VYIEPYPKSKATKLHPDAIDVEKLPNAAEAGTKIPFESFIGVGPRRFSQLFSMAQGGGYEIIRKKGGKTILWDPKASSPRVPMLPMSFLQREQLASELFHVTMNKLESIPHDLRKKNGHR
jgi:hypothetical protein